MTTATTTTDQHRHLPLPTFEWVLESPCETVVPHLKMIATQVTWDGQHFHICEIAPADQDEPELFQIELGDDPVGAINFLPLPANRTLMRLYVCSDIGTVCTVNNGNTVVTGFATALLSRLESLGFVTTAPGASQKRSLGFRALREMES